MKKLFLITILLLGWTIALAQSDSTLAYQYKLYKSLEIDQINSQNILERSFWEYLTENISGKDVALKYINFAENAREKAMIILENPEVMFIDEMNSIEIIELVRSSTPDNLDIGERIDILKERIREKIRKHIQILSDNIQELKSG